MQHKKRIKPLSIIDFSGFSPKAGSIEFAKKQHYFIVTDIAITGDAPKDFIRYYRYGVGRRCNPATWPLYLAKHGHKHYPMEAVTEHMLNRIGEVYGFNMACSGLGWFGGQIRFLSKYFLDKPSEQVLEHGANLYAGFLNDKVFVEDIEKNKQSPDFLTVQFTIETIEYFFPEESKNLIRDFLRMLLFDALIGNNDRHFYNWGIITNLTGKAKPRFSPIFDTARGLFWNDHEDKIRVILSDKKGLEKFITTYSKKSFAKTGWEGIGRLNHFELMNNIRSLPLFQEDDFIRNIFIETKINAVIEMIDNEFRPLISIERRALVKHCLIYRYDHLKKIFNFAP